MMKKLRKTGGVMHVKLDTSSKVDIFSKSFLGTGMDPKKGFLASMKSVDKHNVCTITGSAN